MKPRHLLLTRVVWALSLASLLGACGGGGGGSETAPQPPASVDEKSLSATRPGDLVSYFRVRLSAAVGSGAVAPGGVLSAAPSAPAADAGRFASTTLQEAGVDEDDLLKTDGKLLVSLARGNSAPGTRVQIHQRESTGSLRSLASLALGSEVSYTGLYLASEIQRVLAIGSRDGLVYPMPIDPRGVGTALSLPFAPTFNPRVTLSLLDIANPAAPALLAPVHIDGQLLASRLIGRRLVLVTQWQPPLPSALRASDPRERQAALDKLSNADVLPSITIGTGAPTPLVDESDCFLQGGNASTALQLTTLTVIDLGSPSLARRSRCFIGGAEAVYLSLDSLYLASTRYSYSSDSRGLVYRMDTSTDIHKFALADDRLSYRGSGNVPGHLGWEPEKKSYRLSEHQGDLRVITFTGETGWIMPLVALAPEAGPPVVIRNGPASPAQLSILREDARGGDLQLIASLPNARRPAAIGLPNEQVQAVRFAGERAYVVTFRRTDPLYVLDLSRPDDPRIAGELKTPGFSDYLFPIGTQLLLGVGKDADANGLVTALKVSLFDVADPASPRELATKTYGLRGSSSALDSSRHGINLYTAGELTRIALPVRLHQTPTRYNGWYDATLQGLLRLEVNASRRTLTDKPLLFPVDYSAMANPLPELQNRDLSQDRSVQIADEVFYLSAGVLKGASW